MTTDEGASRADHHAVSNPSFLVLLAVLLVAALALRVVSIEADAPTDVGRDLALSTDGSWYTAAALDRRIHRDCDITAAYDRAPYTLWASIVYELCGPTLAATNLISVPPALIAILFTALTARQLRGNTAGLLAAAFLSFNYSFLVFNRNAVIYSFLAMVAALVLYLVVRTERRRQPWSTIAAWTLTLGAIVSLKEILILLLPALLVARPIRCWTTRSLRGRPLRTLTVMVVACIVTASLGVALDLHVILAQKLRDYFGDTGARDLVDRALTLEERTGFYRALGVLAPLALLAGLRRRLDPGELPLLVVVTAGLLLFAPFRYSPLRYLVVLFPAVCVLAASTVTLLLGAPRENPGKPGTIARALRALLTIYLAHGFASALAPGSTAAAMTLWLLASTGIVLGLRTTTPWRLPSVVTAPRIAALAIAAALGVEMLRCGTAYADSRYTTRAAVREVPAILAPDAVVSGLFSHLLTTGNRLDRKLVSASRFGEGALRRTFERRGVTHLTIEGGEQLPGILSHFAADGAALHHVHTFHVRGTPVLLLRFEFASAFYRPSTYERGVTALDAGRHDVAVRHFEAAAREFPDRAAPLSALAAARLAGGDPEAAIEACRAARRLNPWDLRALGVEADLLLRRGRPEQARSRLEEIRRLDPGNRPVLRALERLRRRDLEPPGTSGRSAAPRGATAGETPTVDLDRSRTVRCTIAGGPVGADLTVRRSAS